MTSNSAGKSERLNEIIAEYLQAVEAGEKPDQQGFLSGHPEFAGDLRQFFDDKARFERMTEALKPPGDARAALPSSADRASSKAASAVGPGSNLHYFGDYELLEEIARGGMGVVYKARQSTLKRIVALKMILSGQLAGEEDVKRFYAEAEAAAKLDHPNIVPIFEIGQHEGQHYFSMAFVEGESLARKVVAGPLPPREAAQLMKKVTEAVTYAHIEGVVHRDLKPANVLLDKDGEPRVTDFGLAKRISAESLTTEAADSAGLTATGQILGTPSYMPPEQAAGKSDEVGALADVYSLGAMLYCLLTGRPPFQAASPLDTLLQVLQKDPLPVRQLDPEVPRDLETICSKCLDKDPRRRYASAREFGDDLQRFINGEPVKARPIGKVARSWRWCRRNPVVASLSATAATLVVAVGLAVTVGYLKTKEALDLSNLYLYVAQVDRARQSLEAGNEGRAFRLLEEYAPLEAGREDLRGWEWYYVRAQSRILLGMNLQRTQTFFPRIKGIAWNPDGRRLATVTSHGDLWIWDVADAIEGDVLRGRKPPLSGVGAGTAVRDNLEPIVLFKPEHYSVTEPGWIRPLAWSPDGKLLALGSDEDQTVKVWDVAKHEQIVTLRGYSANVVALAFSGDGRRLASASTDQTVRVWDIATGKELFTLTAERDAPSSGKIVLAWGPNDDWLAVTYMNGNRTKLWDAATGKEIRSIDTEALGWSPDRERFADLFNVVDATTNEQIVEFRTEAPAGKLAWSPNGRWLAGRQSGDFGIAVWDASTGQKTLDLSGRNNRSFAWSPDSRWLAAAGSLQITIWDTAPRREPVTFRGHSQGVASVAWSPDGKLLASGGANDRTVKVWDSETGEELQTFRGNGRAILCVAFSGDGRHLASIDSSGSVKVWDTQAWQEVTTMSLRQASTSTFGSQGRLAWSADGRWLAAASGHRSLRVWQSEGWREVFKVEKPAGPWVCHLVGWCHDGQLAFEDTSQDISSSGLKLWNPDTGKGPSTIRKYQAWHGSMNWRSEDQLLVTGNVTWRPNSRQWATIGTDGFVKIWGKRSDQELFTLPGIGRAIAFSPDGWRLAATQGNSEVIIWDARARSRDPSRSSND